MWMTRVTLGRELRDLDIMNRSVLWLTSMTLGHSLRF